MTLFVPVILGLADALLVNWDDRGLELNLSLVAALVLPLRHRFPLLVFLLTLPGIFIGYVWFAPMIAIYTVAAARPGRAVLSVSVLLLAAAHFVPYPVSELDPTAYRENALALIDALLTSIGPTALGLLVATRGELASRIGDLTRSRRHADQLLAERVVGTERARLAREMHDVVAHQVSLISLQAGAVQISTHDAAAREGARAVRELAVRTLDELRHMVGVLRAAGGEPDGLTPQPRLADLPRLIEVSALNVDYDAAEPAEPSEPADPATGPPRPATQPPEAVERAAFRTVQEALTNVRKHAPGARVRVRISETPAPDSEMPTAAEDAAPDAPRGTRLSTADANGEVNAEVNGEAEAIGASVAEARACGEGGRPGLRVEVRNGPPDAAAMAPQLPGGGHGLVGLRERAQLLGGTFSARHTDDGGFVVSAHFPFAAERCD
nr:histidine kinase [Streptomyces zagrosensis]